MLKITTKNSETKTSTNITVKTEIESEEFQLNSIEISTIDNLQQKEANFKLKNNTGPVELIKTRDQQS